MTEISQAGCGDGGAMVVDVSLGEKEGKPPPRRTQALEGGRAIQTPWRTALRASGCLRNYKKTACLGLSGCAVR